MGYRPGLIMSGWALFTCIVAGIIFGMLFGYAVLHGGLWQDPVFTLGTGAATAGCTVIGYRAVKSQ